jgi:hypothetical protein
MLQELVDVDEVAERRDDGSGGDPEEIDPYDEQDGVQDAGYDDPLPQLMPGDKVMRFDVRLEGYNKFFEQRMFFFLFWVL